MIALKDLLYPLYSGFGSTGFIIISMMVPLLVTQLANNVVCVTVFVPIMCAFLDECGVDPYMLSALGCWILNIAFVTAPASGPAAIIFGHNWMNVKTAYIYGIYTFFLTVVLGLGVGIPLANFVF